MKNPINEKEIQHSILWDISEIEMEIARRYPRFNPLMVRIRKFCVEQLSKAPTVGMKESK